MKPFVPLISILALLPAAALAAPGPADYVLRSWGPPGSVAQPAKPPPGFCLLQSASLRIGSVPVARPSSSLAPACKPPQAVFDNHLADTAPQPWQLIIGTPAR